MNPILNLMKNQKTNNRVKTTNNVQSMVNDLKSGKVDAKQSSLDIIKKMSPQQRIAIRQMLPQITKLGKAFGVSDEQIERFTKELNSSL